MIPLTLAHSPDPDDAFMWWPITGMITPEGRVIAPPVIETGEFVFRAVPRDIEALNREAVGAAPHEITALSVRAWADARDRYAITACGASFGDGYGPKLVCRAVDAPRIDELLRRPDATIAIPGARTTAYLVLRLALAERIGAARPGIIETPFEQVIPEVSAGRALAGLVIHEGQVAFADEGLALVIDTGAWWKERHGLKLPLGVNAIRRDLDETFGAGTITRVSGLLNASVEHAMARREQSTAYTVPFAAANARRAGTPPPDLARVDRYCRLYVTEDSRYMGESGRRAIERLLSMGASAGLCPDPGRVEFAGE